MIIVLFGLPGVGKSFIAEVFRDNFGFYIYDADKKLPLAAFQAIKKKRMVSEVTRQKFYKRLIKDAAQLEKKYGSIVVPRTFTYNRSRSFFKKLLPQSQFILVKASHKIRSKRVIKRDHHIDLEYAKKFDSIFEKPDISHFVIKNTRRGKTILRRQISTILKKVQGKNKTKAN